MLFKQIFDPKLAQYAYLIGCQQTKEALIVDPERDIDRYVEIAEAEGLTIVAVAETHIHADFLSGAREFAEVYGARLYLSDEGDSDWKYEWAAGPKLDGSEYDAAFLKDGQTFTVGHIEFEAVHTPGHTPEHLSFLVTDRGSGATSPIGVVTGDFVFVGDLGRPDLLEQAAGLHGVQESSARRLYKSLPTFTALEDHLQVWPGHGAGSTCGRALGAVPMSTVGYEKLYNPSLDAAARGEDAFVRAILAGQPEPQMYFVRMKRDNRKGAPVLGRLPRPRKLTARELGEISARGEAVVIDTRLDRSAFMARHIPGALHAPLNRSFNAVVGSLVVDETAPLVLIVQQEDLDEAVRDLVRVGYDNISAFAEVDTLQRFFNDGGAGETTEEISFDEMESRRGAEGVIPLDVRFASEFAEGHVPRARNASYTRLPEYVKDANLVPRDKKLLVYCASGARSAAAASFLAREGFDVALVNGSFGAYAEGREVESTEADVA